jgi:anti-sigma factor RsiW
MNNRMPCSYFEERILEHFDAALTTEGQREVEAHLAECAECRRFFRAQQELDAALGERFCAPALPPQFQQRVLSRIEHLPPPARVSPLPEILDFVGCAGLAVAALCAVRYLPEFSLPESLPPGLSVYASWAVGAVAGIAGFSTALRELSRQRV